MVNRTLLSATLVAALTLGVASGAVGNGGLPALTVNPASVQPGQTFTVSGTDCFLSTLGIGDAQVVANGELGPVVEVSVAFSPPLNMSTNADLETGNWSVTFTVPAGTPPGAYAVNATCLNELKGDSVGGDVGAAQVAYPPGSVTVTAPPVPATAPPTPAQTPAPVPPAPPAPAVAAAPRTAG